MWLLNTETLDLEEFITGDGVRYAILSHRWGKQEVLFRDMSDLGKAAKTKVQGYRKVKGFCNHARSQGYRYAWMDTCCIDKSSSAELSEAINSMYRWYERAAVCYVYLADVSSKREDSGFERSDWFTRGWTLQELLAPSKVLFYDRDWQLLGEKKDLADKLSSITGVAEPALLDPSCIPEYSLKERMTWASARNTTRPEDEAYCLLGLFNVNMPLLYGEGSKAFIRLQEQIIKDSTDRSIFAWHVPKDLVCGLLALSPAAFKQTLPNASGRVFEALDSVRVSMAYSRSTYAMTNRGLSIECLLWPIRHNIYIANILHTEHQRFDIVVARTDKSRSSEYVRIVEKDQRLLAAFRRDRWIHPMVSKTQLSRPYVQKRIIVSQQAWAPQDDRSLNGLQESLFHRTIKWKVPFWEHTDQLRLDAHIVFGEWNDATRTLSAAPEQVGTTAIFECSMRRLRGLARFFTAKILLGIGVDFDPVCVISVEDFQQKAAVRNRYGRDFSYTFWPFSVAENVLEDVSCLETEGWTETQATRSGSMLLFNILRFERLQPVSSSRPGFWAVKVQKPVTMFSIRPYEDSADLLVQMRWLEDDDAWDLLVRAERTSR